jgi:hypothetical protein
MSILPVSHASLPFFSHADGSFCLVARADIEFTFPIESKEEEELRLIFKWEPALMQKVGAPESLADFYSDPPLEIFPAQSIPSTEILMFALPHHQERLRTTIESSNKILKPGCMPTIHGIACPVSPSLSSLLSHLIPFDSFRLL